MPTNERVPPAIRLASRPGIDQIAPASANIFLR